MNFSPPVVIGAAGVLALGAALLLLLLRKRKSAAELERERRLAVNAIGRLKDGVIIEAERFDSSHKPPGLVFYRYSAAGVEYSAAQDLALLQHLVPEGSCAPGLVVTVKYDPHIPSNSIILCERWSGLRAPRERRESTTSQLNRLQVGSRENKSV